MNASLCPEPTAKLSGKPHRGIFSADACVWQVEAYVSQGGRLGWDGACLESVSAFSHDPIGYAGGMNLYAYCGDNPVNATDPMGTADTSRIAEMCSALDRIKASSKSRVEMLHRSANLLESYGDYRLARTYKDLLEQENPWQNNPRVLSPTLAGLAIAPFTGNPDMTLGYLSVIGGAEDRFRRSVVEGVSGRTHEDLVVGLVQVAQNACTGTYSQDREWILEQPGRRPFDFGVTIGTDPLTYVALGTAAFKGMKGLSMTGGKTPTLYWHGTESAVESANIEGLFAHGWGNGGKYWATELSSRNVVTDVLIGGTQNVDSLVPFRLSSKGAFEAVYTLTDEEAALFSRAWGPSYSWNPYNWYKGAFGQYYCQSSAVTWGQRATELGQGTIITGAIGGGAYGLSYLNDQR